MRRQSPLDERSRILLAHLRSHDSSRVAYVRTALAEMDPDEAVQVLLGLMQSVRHDLKRLPIRVISSVASMWLGCWIVDWAMGKPHLSMWQVAFFAVIPVFIALSNFRHGRNKVYRFLARYDDKRIADVLIEAMRVGDPLTQRASEPTLLRLLAALTPSDWYRLSPASRSFLNLRLLESSDPQLVRAILAAWEQIGNHDSIPFVERLSHGEGVLGGDFSIRHAAAEALPAIREAASRTATAETLLRATAAGESATALLRPASSAESSDQALLRPAAD